MAWKDIPEKKVLATLKDRKTFKGVAAEKMTIYVDGAVPGGDGDVQGISMTIDPSTYVMTTQLKDGKGGNVGSPATIDLPLESMVVSGEYDEENKSIILTLKNGQTVEFSVADLVSGLQTEITSENPLSADLIEETTNKNFVTEQEKEDIDDIQSIRDSITDIESSLDGKQDTIDENNPLDASFIDDENSNKKLVTPEQLDAVEQVAQDVDSYARMSGDEYHVRFENNDGLEVDVEKLYASDEYNPFGAMLHLGGASIELTSGRSTGIEQYDEGNGKVHAGSLTEGTYYFYPNHNVRFFIDDSESYEIAEGGTIIRCPQYDDMETVYYIPANGGCPISYTRSLVDDSVTVNATINEAELQAQIGAVYSEIAKKQNKIDANNKLSADLIAETNNNKVMTSAERTKLAGIAAGAEVNVQADWNQTNSSADDYIKNKPASLGESVIYFNAESSGYLLNVENIAFYKDSQLTEEMTPGEMFQLTNKGPVNLIGMYNNDLEFIPWTSEVIIDGADDGMDGEGNSFFFRVLEGGSTGTVAYYGDEWHILDKMNFLTSSDVEGLVKKGSGAPTTSTTGVKGQLYEDTTNGKVYICTNRSGSTYTWKEVIKNGDNVSTLTNDAGYQNASQVSSAIASAVGQITSFEYQVVQTLPVTGEKGVIYLVANSGTAPNIYDEYIWVNNAFEKIGTTDIDLSGYATTQDLEDGLATKADAIDPSDLPSGSTQNGVITTSDHTDIDPSVVSEGQIVVDSTENKVYIVSDITTDPQTGDPVIVWKEIQTDEMVILDYGTSTWSEFLTAYNDKRIVYCRASSGTDPSVGDKTRMAFMAYITNPSNPTGVEFQYYRSVNTKSASNQTDQVVVYKLTSNGNWTVETRNTNVKIVAGTNMTSSYSGGVLTLSADLSSKQDVIDSTHKLSADLIDSSTSDDKTYQTGTGAPTTSTEGSVGEMYVDKSTGTVYVCTDTTGGTYTWNEVSGGGDGITELTSADYDFHSTGSTDDGVALWRLEPGVYYTGSGVKSYISSDGKYSNTPRMYLIGPSFGSGNNAKNITELTAVPSGVALVTDSVSSSGVLIASKSMPADVPVITMTSTDPGEGSDLAENHFIAVYEV